MPPRSTWKGYLNISLVSLPVKAYTASASDGGQIHLNQLHRDCNRRIRYQKVCPEHGEVPNDEIVSGYEFAKDQYVVIDPSEIEKLRAEKDKAIAVESFVPADQVDPMQLSGRTYYLLPDGPVGQKPYALIRQCMTDENVYAVAQVVLSGREQLVLLRPVGDVLTMSVLNYASQLKQPSAFQDELVETDLNEKEKELTRQLVTALTDEDFDLGNYTDKYTERMTELIESKVQGKELVSPPAQEMPHIINLMDALKESVQRIKVPEKAKKPARKMAASKRQPTAKKAAKTTTRKKRKSG